MTKLLHLIHTTPTRASSEGRVFSYTDDSGVPLCQKGLAVTCVFSHTLTIEASVADLQPLVMCTANGLSCIALGGDDRIKFILLAVLLDLMNGARR
jgi:hypothetical protein